MAEPLHFDFRQPASSEEHHFIVAENRTKSNELIYEVDGLSVTLTGQTGSGPAWLLQGARGVTVGAIVELGGVMSGSKVGVGSVGMGFSSDVVIESITVTGMSHAAVGAFLSGEDVIVSVDGKGETTIDFSEAKDLSRDDLLSDFFTMAGDGGGFALTGITVSMVPEPTTLLLMTAGVGLLGGTAASRRRKKERSQ